MIRKTLYGTLTQDEELNENEKAMLYIKECAESVGLEVIEGKTAFDIQFMADVMKRLRENQEPCEDCISREHLLEEIASLKESPWFKDDTNCAMAIRKEAIEIVEDLCIRKEPSVTPQLCEDVISRQAAIDAVRNNTFRLTFAEEKYCEGNVAWSAKAVYSDVIEGALLELPPATPHLKVGRWIDEGWYAEGHSEHAYRCSECGVHYIGYAGEFKYCPNCKKRMQEVGE